MSPGIEMNQALGEPQSRDSILPAYRFSLLSDRELADHGIFTSDRQMQRLFTYLKALARSPRPVLISGETGTGKNLFARAIHRMSGCKGDFVAVNLAGMDEHVLADTLFGHLQWAYPGANQAREGLIARARGGTLLINEIGDLTEASQVKLLRLLEDNEYCPLGSHTSRTADARLVCVTQGEPAERSAAKKFRRDLYYCLSAHHIRIPPLRERVGDIPLLVDRFLDDAARAMGKKKPTPPPELFTLLAVYHFPGNVRELKAMVWDAMVRHRSGILSVASFRKCIENRGTDRAERDVASSSPEGNATFARCRSLPTIREAVEDLIAEAMSRAGNNQTIAATLLGIQRATLNKRLSRKRSPKAKP